MLSGALTMWSAGHMNREMPRYLFQRIRWKERGIVENTARYVLEMQKEVGMQGVMNAAVLCIPAFLQANDKGPATVLEGSGYLLWLASLVFEHTADLQKLAFLQANKRNGGPRGAVCDVGLWSWTRHPNYFGEWMVWNALMLASVSSLQRFWKDQNGSGDANENESKKKNNEDIWTKLGMTGAFLSVSYGMYVCLTWWTGAIPAEHFSLAKRPAFAEYMRRYRIDLTKITFMNLLLLLYFI